MKKELAPKYDSKLVEEGKYSSWIEQGYFTAGDKSKDPYCIVIPPPNVTGKLHLGHAWDNTLQDMIARYKRLSGYDMLYLPGMDHAGIATQAKVDARLKDEGISRYDIGREKFLERAWQWKDEYAGHIRQQWAKLGNSLDYTRERFTLDEGLNQAVTKVFVEYYRKGLIYQGERIINWDTKAKTALSNIEVIHKEVEGKMYTFNYTVQETGEHFDVATTRPETMFGDVCVVVHPDDERFQHLVGLHAINPANHQPLEIIADDYIDISFGTGAMKCTPAHDPNDFQIAERHHLPKVICMNPDGTMNELCGEYEGMDRIACRDAVTEKIKNEGNLVKIETIVHQVGHSERTDVIVEPYLSKQWFVKMKPLAEEVLKNQQNPDQKINFYPARFEKIFTQWLENIEDWCISRQLWWGHRIPAWYHHETGEVYVNEVPPTDIENWTQDEDVLDTWFSSALWPFSTLGWPESTEDLKRYYPTNCMVTGYDIIFFWVARMAFQARYFTKSYPFKDCLIHGLIRDEQGRKMSKSLGNGIDPMDVINQYGVDSLRLFLTTNSTPGQDMRYIPSKVEAAWNFINKLWNATRFVMMNLDETIENESLDSVKLSMIDNWILDKLNQTITSVTHNMERYEFALVGNELIRFIRDDFCSWYIELAKANLNQEDSQIKKATQVTLYTVLHAIVRLLHPFIPFVTEEIYVTLQTKDEACCKAAWPTVIAGINTDSNTEVEQLISMIEKIRELKVDHNLKPSTSLEVLVKDSKEQVQHFSKTVVLQVEKMTKCRLVDHLEGELSVVPIYNGSLSVLSGDLSNVEEEKAKLALEKERLEKEITRGETMLRNPNFINKAPQAKVTAEQEKLEGYKSAYQIVLQRLSELI